MNNQLIGALDIGTYKTKFLISSLDDKNFIKSLMVQELDPGKTASWITKPKRGINNQDIEYNYVDLN